MLHVLSATCLDANTRVFNFGNLNECVSPPKELLSDFYNAPEREATVNDYKPGAYNLTGRHRDLMKRQLTQIKATHAPDPG